MQVLQSPVSAMNDMPWTGAKSGLGCSWCFFSLVQNAHVRCWKEILKENDHIKRYEVLTNWLQIYEKSPFLPITCLQFVFKFVIFGLVLASDVLIIALSKLFFGHLWCDFISGQKNRLKMSGTIRDF